MHDLALTIAEKVSFNLMFQNRKRVGILEACTPNGCFAEDAEKILNAFQNRKRYGGMHDLQQQHYLRKLHIQWFQNRKRYGGMHDPVCTMDRYPIAFDFKFQNRKRYGGMHDFTTHRALTTASARIIVSKP